MSKKTVDVITVKDIRKAVMQLTNNNHFEEKVCFYKDFYGLPLSRWDRMMNHLWFYVCEKNMLWAKIIYSILRFFEKSYFGVLDRFNKLDNN